MSTTLLRLIILLSPILLLAQSVSALTIISPYENQVVNAGTRVDVVVKPDAGEKWDKVLLAIFPMSYSIFSGEYKETIEIPQDALGIISITILAADQTGKEIELRRNIIAKLPPDVVLKSIAIYPDYIVLEKMPPGSKPEDIEAFGSINLIITGMYSDSVKRKLTASSSGTTYTSSNEKVVAVNSEGRVTAQGLGSATIAVRNGKYSANVKVVVKTYK